MKFDEYINSLEGQENLDLTEVVANLVKLHTEEVGHVTTTSSAMIDELNTKLGEKDALVAEKEQELTRAQADNWKLANQIPSSAFEKEEPSTDGEIDQKRITLDDAFAQ